MTLNPVILVYVCLMIKLISIQLCFGRLLRQLLLSALGSVLLHLPPFSTGYFRKLIEPILLYAVEQWIPYVHPRMIDKSGLTPTLASPTSELNTEDIWKRMIYSHYQLGITTPLLAVRSELGSFPTYIPGVSHLANYMSYISSPWAPTLVHKAVLAQQAIASQAKFCWWNNCWHMLSTLNLSPSNILSTNSHNVQEDLQGQFRRWWLHFSNPSNMPKLRTFPFFKTSFAPSAYLNEGPYITLLFIQSLVILYAYSVTDIVVHVLSIKGINIF